MQRTLKQKQKAPRHQAGETISKTTRSRLQKFVVQYNMQDLPTSRPELYLLLLSQCYVKTELSAHSPDEN